MHSPRLAYLGMLAMFERLRSPVRRSVVEIIETAELLLNDDCS